MRMMLKQTTHDRSGMNAVDRLSTLLMTTHVLHWHYSLDISIEPDVHQKGTVYASNYYLYDMFDSQEKHTGVPTEVDLHFIKLVNVCFHYDAWQVLMFSRCRVRCDKAQQHGT